MPEEIRSRPPTTDTFSLPQTQEEFYFALPYDQHGPLPLRARTTASPPPRSRRVRRADGRAGRARLQGHRGEAARHALPARARRCSSTPVDARARDGTMCGIAGIVALERRRAAADRASARARWPAALAPPRPRRVRRLPRRARAGSRTRACRSSTSRPGSSRSRTRTRRLWIVFNGEIFNYVELRDELEALGHRFRTQSDTEVIVHAYEAWGDAALRALQRAVRDRALGRARARARARARPPRRAPLYLCEHGGRALLRERGEGDLRRRSGRSRARSIRSASTETFTFWTVVPPQTVFRGRRRARARARPHVRRRRADATSAFMAPRYAVADAEELPGLARRGGRAGARRARGRDAPAHAARRRPGRQLPLGRPRQLARRGARAARPRAAASRRSRSASRTPSTTRPRTSARWSQRLGSEHHEVVVVAARHRASLSRRSSATPSGRSCAPRRRRSSCCRGSCATRGIKVVLTGEGADEMFAGYDLFREAKVRRFWARSPTRRCGRACSSGSTRTWRARRSRSGRWRGSSSAAGSSARREPGFAHEPRWRTATRAEAALLAADMREAAARVDVTARLLATLPAEFASWSSCSRRISTSRSARCSPATSSRRRAIAC